MKEDFTHRTPRNVRVSVGSAVILGLAQGRLDANPTTVYMLTYIKGKCASRCAFCSQSGSVLGRGDKLSRVIWPVFKTQEIIPRIAETFEQGKIRRTCIQALNYPTVKEDIIQLVTRIRSLSEIPISVSCQPLSRVDMLRLAKAGVARVGIALDAVTSDLFDKVKGTSIGGLYTWEGHFKTLREAVEVFGNNHITTHLIAGLGEKEEDFIEMIQRCVDLGVYPALFAFTPIPGTVMASHPPPPLDYYRKLQIAHFLITQRVRRYENMKFKNRKLVDFDLSRKKLLEIIRTGEPFRTSGCPGCNRPYYNERPGGPIFNYPVRPSAEETATIEKDLCL